MLKKSDMKNVNLITKNVFKNYLNVPQKKLQNGALSI